MSSGCGDVLSLEDLKTAKKHQTFEAEVITGKTDGLASGADIDYATNQVTGQVQKTLPAVLRDAGFRPASFTFTTGGNLTVNDADLAVLWPISDGGDGQYYAWHGALPKTIPAGSTPATSGGVSDTAWKPIGDITLRSELASAGSSVLISGTEASKVAFSTNITSAVNTVQELMSSSIPANIDQIFTSGYYNVFGKRDLWIRAGTTGDPSQTPIQRNSLSVTDASGAVWNLDISSGFIYFDSLGAKGTGISTDDDWYYLELALKNAEQGTNRVVRGYSTAYYFSKPILLKSGRHLEFMAKFGLDITYGGVLLSETDAPAATTPAGFGFTSTFSDKQAQIVVAHSSSKYANYWSIKNCYIKNAGGVSSSYGIYCPFANNFEVESVWSVGGMIGFDGRNIYAYSFMACYFSPPNSTMGTVGFNVTPIQNGLGSGTSGTFVRVGITNYNFSWFMNEMNYTSLTSCYSEGNLTRKAFSFSRCNGLNINTYGIENLTAVSGDGRIAIVNDSQVSFNGLQASFNINLSAATAISVSGNSQVTINDLFIASATSATAYSTLVTDNTSRVRMFGFKYTGVTPGSNAIGSQTVIYGDPGRTECMAVPGAWNGGFIRIGAVRLWDDGTGLRIKRGGDPGSATDGVPL